MFMGPWAQGGPWSPTGIEGVNRFLRRVWTTVNDPTGRESGDPTSGRLPDGQTAHAAGEELRRHAHRTLERVTADYDDFGFNTMVSALMELTNRLVRLRGTEIAGGPEWDEAVRLLLLMLAPLAPHISEELWGRRLQARGEQWSSVHTQSWPRVDPELVRQDEIDLPVQVNGKLRDLVTVPAGLSEIEIEQIVLARDKIRAQLDGHEVVRVIHVAGRLVNVVIKPR
jgi:leucyl-tRNA synthetase